MSERAPGLREDWRLEAINDPVTAAAVAPDPEGAVLVFAFMTARRGIFTVLEQPTRALELARMIVEQANRKGWQPKQHAVVPETELKLEAPAIMSRAWVFDSAVILTFQLSNGRDHSFLLPSHIALTVALVILRQHERGSFVDLNSAAPEQAQKH